MRHVTVSVQLLIDDFDAFAHSHIFCRMYV